MRTEFFSEVGAALRVYIEKNTPPKEWYAVSIGLFNEFHDVTWGHFPKDDLQHAVLSEWEKTTLKHHASLLSAAKTTWKSPMLPGRTLAQMREKQSYLFNDAIAEDPTQFDFDVLDIKTFERAWNPRANRTNLILDFKTLQSKIPSQFVPCLIPLVQHQYSGSVLLGVIIVHATKNAELWRHLPVIKALALPLLGHRASAFGISPESARDVEVEFLELFLTHHGGKQLFTAQKQWGRNPKQLYHDFDPRLIRNDIGGFVESCSKCKSLELTIHSCCTGTGNFNLSEGGELCAPCITRAEQLIACHPDDCWGFKKALFCETRIGAENPTAESVGRRIYRDWGNPIQVGQLADCLEKTSTKPITDKSKLNRDELINLPSRVGLWSVLAINWVISAVKGKSFSINVDERYVEVVVSLDEAAIDASNPMGLGERFLEIGNAGLNRRQESQAASPLRSAIFGDFSHHHPRYSNHSAAKANPHTQSLRHGLPTPLFILNIRPRELVLWWERGRKP